MFHIIGPDFETMTVRGFGEAMKIARETARFIGWAKVFESDSGENVLILRRCRD